MKLISWIRLGGEIFLGCAYITLGIFISQSHMTSQHSPCKPCDLKDPELWTKSDLLGLFNFCSNETPWPRPQLNLTQNTTTLSKRQVAIQPPPASDSGAPPTPPTDSGTPPTPATDSGTPPTTAQSNTVQLHRSFRMCNKAWSNLMNAPKKTKFTTEEIVLLDGFDASASEVASYKNANKGTIVLGYLSVGSMEDWRIDVDKWPSDCIGKAYDGWAGERWLNVDQWEKIKPVMLARLKMLKDKGFHGYEGDNVAILDQYSSDEQAAKKPYAIAYAKWLAETAHSMGLLAIFKNGGYMTNDVSQYYDGIIVESGVQYKEMDVYLAYHDQQKPIWIFEYSGDSTGISSYLKSSNILGKVSDVQLDHVNGWERIV